MAFVDHTVKLVTLLCVGAGDAVIGEDASQHPVWILGNVLRTASAIHYEMIVNGYIDRKGILTDKYYEDKANGEIKVAEEVADSAASVIEIVDSIYDAKSMQPENARSNNVELQVDEDKLAMPEFKALWSKINAKSVYVVDFDTDELIKKQTNWIKAVLVLWQQSLQH